MNIPLDIIAALRLSMLVSLAVVAACGGVGSGGTGAEIITLSNGTVTGFGSVIVDGTRFDDRGASTVVEAEPGNEVVTEIRLGDRLEVVSEVAGVAKTLRVEATVVGVVTAMQSGGFQVLGQTVSINTDATLGPVTQLAGYTMASDVQTGHVVEVHGVHKVSGNADVVQATRVEKRSGLPTFLRVSGQVHALGAGASKQFTLGALTVDYGSATIEPVGAELVDGASVLVFAPPDRLTTQSGGSQRLNAAALRIKSLRSDASDAYASGIVAQLDTTNGRFQLSGLRVTYSPAAISPAGKALANGQYVQARGQVAADGSLAAKLVTIRDGRSQPEAELKGTLSGFDAAANTFVVRGVLVAVNGAALQGCPSTGLVNGLFVEVEGVMSASGVVARKVQCESEPSDALIEREGVAGSVDLVNSTFSLKPENSAAIPVSWNALTFFGGVTPQTLNGMKVQAQGVLVNGVLQASKVKR